MVSRGQLLQDLLHAKVDVLLPRFNSRGIGERSGICDPWFCGVSVCVCLVWGWSFPPHGALACKKGSALFKIPVVLQKGQKGLRLLVPVV